MTDNDDDNDQWKFSEPCLNDEFSPSPHPIIRLRSFTPAYIDQLFPVCVQMYEFVYSLLGNPCSPSSCLGRGLLVHRDSCSLPHHIWLYKESQNPLNLPTRVAGVHAWWARGLRILSNPPKHVDFTSHRRVTKPTAHKLSKSSSNLTSTTSFKWSTDGVAP